MANTRKRPGVVLAAAIMLFIFGGLAVLGSFCGIAGELLQGVMPKPPVIQGQKPFDPNREINEKVPSKIFVESSFHVLNLILGMVKIFAGIGLLRMAAWARVTTFIAAGLSIFGTIALSAYQAIFIIPISNQVVADQLKNAPPMPFDFGQFMLGFMWIAVVLGVVFSLAIWLTVIFLLSGAKVRAAFAAAASDSPDQDEEDERSRSRYEGYDDDDRPRPAPKSPGDTGITDRS
jgi:hypothetical protein